MERHEVLAMMTALKLAGMRAAYDDILADGLKRRHPVQQIRRWDRGRRQAGASSTRWRPPAASKELADFDFAASPVNADPGTATEGKRSCWSAAAPARPISPSPSARIRKAAYNVVDLVNHLEADDQLIRRDFVILDELGCPSPRPAASCCSI